MTEQQFLLSIIRELVSLPDSVEVSRSVDDKGILLRIKVAKEDMPNLIGRKGQNVLAIRTVTKMYGGRAGENISIIVSEPV